MKNTKSQVNFLMEEKVWLKIPFAYRKQHNCDIILKYKWNSIIIMQNHHEGTILLLQGKCFSFFLSYILDVVK